MKKLIKYVKNIFNTYLNKFRLWLMKSIFTDDEKYLINRAIEDRIECLYKTRVTERWADSKDIKTDIKDYEKISCIFSTDSWI